MTESALFGSAPPVVREASGSSVVVVTGGGSGMGRAIALRAVASSRPVIVVGRRDEALQATAAKASPGAIETVQADLSGAEGAQRVVDALRGRTVDGVVTAAGANTGFLADPKTLDQVEAAWTTALRTNLYTAVLVAEGLLPHMTAGTGRIVLIGSTAALDGIGGPYATAKAALHGYVLDLARRAGVRQVTANVVAPGWVTDTEFLDRFDVPVQARDQGASATLVGRLGTTDDVAACVEWLLNDPGWVTGQVVSINGGTAFVH